MSEVKVGDKAVITTDIKTYATDHDDGRVNELVQCIGELCEVVMVQLSYTGRAPCAQVKLLEIQGEDIFLYYPSQFHILEAVKQ